MAKGASVLAGDVVKCRQKWAAADHQGHSSSLQLEDGAVKFQLAGPGGSLLSVSIIFLMPESYPDGPAMACCEQDETVSAMLAQVNEYYEDSATLPQLLTHIFRVLKAGQKHCSHPGLHSAVQSLSPDQQQQSFPLDTRNLNSMVHILSLTVTLVHVQIMTSASTKTIIATKVRTPWKSTPTVKKMPRTMKLMTTATWLSVTMMSSPSCLGRCAAGTTFCQVDKLIARKHQNFRQSCCPV